MSGHGYASAFAPAKVNLALHVTGQRDDGYHLLDSLVMLTNVGDTLHVRLAERTSLEVSGPKAKGVPTDDSNLVMRAAALTGLKANIRLEKYLPTAAGIGGGSSDAAACLRALSIAGNTPLPCLEAQATLGADVPVCMFSDLVRVKGVGQHVEVLGQPPDWPMILVNPGVEVATASVFSMLSSKNNAPLAGEFPLAGGWDTQVTWLHRQRNDLEAPAVLQAPVIGSVLEVLRRSEGCNLARMSGSGATCFAIMENTEKRDATVAALQADHPNWWVVATEKCGALFS